MSSDDNEKVTNKSRQALFPLAWFSDGPRSLALTPSSRGSESEWPRTVWESGYISSPVLVLCLLAARQLIIRQVTAKDENENEKKKKKRETNKQITYMRVGRFNECFISWWDSVCKQNKMQWECALEFSFNWYFYIFWKRANFRTRNLVRKKNH